MSWLDKKDKLHQVKWRSMNQIRKQNKQMNKIGKLGEKEN